MFGGAYLNSVFMSSSASLRIEIAFFSIDNRVLSDPGRTGDHDNGTTLFHLYASSSMFSCDVALHDYCSQVSRRSKKVNTKNHRLGGFSFWIWRSAGMP